MALPKMDVNLNQIIYQTDYTTLSDLMADIPYNSPKAICTASQIRSKLEQKLKMKLQEQRIIGPLDPYIIRACKEGFFDRDTMEELLKVSIYCDNVLLSSDFSNIPEFDVLVGWSKLIDEL